mmetsp:Transcript_38703/g.90874  ORF Transcript_38703/g.90874 Transcript_38703/m.90874 type:complete len:197 (-) Transcript_38703:36-626(-)
MTSKRDGALVAMRNEDQPSWARHLLRQEGPGTDDNEDAGHWRSPLSVKSSADLLHLLRAGDGSGIVVDEELAQCYPGVLDDIQSLVSSKAIRSVRPQKEEKSRRPTRRSSASVIATQAAATAERHLLGDVLFSCFEPEVEALQVDADLREAFHATRRPTQGDVAARIAVKAQEAPTKRARRASQKPRKVQNAHMSG